MPVIPLVNDHIPSVAKLHASALAGDLLPSLGEDFLQEFYTAALSTSVFFGYVYLEDHIIAGFTCGSSDTSALFRSVISDASWRLFRSAFPALIHHPDLVFQAIETLYYPKRTLIPAEKAELLVISVQANLRNRGIGKSLVQVLENTFIEKGIHAYKVTVLQSHEQANQFYLRNGYKVEGVFRLHQREWNLYVKEIM
jgi:ribosomal protein S18 acetylase RimI-like enzyme